MIHRRPSRMPGKIPCSSIEYTARRPIFNRCAISGTEILLPRCSFGAPGGRWELESLSGWDIGLVRPRLHSQDPHQLAIRSPPAIDVHSVSTGLRFRKTRAMNRQAQRSAEKDKEANMTNA